MREDVESAPGRGAGLTGRGPLGSLELPTEMPVKSIQLGQVWRHDESGQDYLVTKVYSEVFSQFAILRRADATAASGETTRVKIQKTSDGVSLPGYTFTQDSEEF